MKIDLKSIYSPPPNYPSLSWTFKSEVQLNVTMRPHPPSRPTLWIVKSLMGRGGGPVDGGNSSSKGASSISPTKARPRSTLTLSLKMHQPVKWLVVLLGSSLPSLTNSLHFLAKAFSWKPLALCQVYH